MKDLIERLEKARGPSRDLDVEIERVMNPGHPMFKEPPEGSKTGFSHGTETSWGWGVDWQSGGGMTWGFSKYTGSLDVALSMVPRGAGLRLDRYWLRDRVAWTAVASTGGVPSNPAQQFTSEDAYSPALALCIAGLKARAAATIPEAKT